MTTRKAAKNAAKMTSKTVSRKDDGESITLMEPMVLSSSNSRRATLNDWVVELSSASAGFQRSLPIGMSDSLRDLVRAMNCYYSNLIEGHNTHPIDIERALKEDYSRDTKKRNLQLESKAHIRVQEWIDHGGLGSDFYTARGILSVHRRFCDEIPDDLLWVENPDSKDRHKVVPGEFRNTNVKVGRHIPISAGAIDRFMGRFQETYGRLGTSELILSAAAAHHRLVWIHPFLDGNGRVARLISYACLLHALKSGGLWSIARGLSRSVADYKSHLMACDRPRQGDLDGRGNLSEQSLADFTEFFLKICIDQVKFMEGLLAPHRFRERVLHWAEFEIRQKNIPRKSSELLKGLLYQGEIARRDVAGLIDASERSSRRLVSELLDKEILYSLGAKASLRLRMNTKNASQWLPGLFPEKIDS